jgi:polar amino acid transport system substrate-binding protein
MVIFGLKKVALILLFSVGVPVFAQPCLEMHVIHNAPLGYLDVEGNPTGTHWDYLGAIAEHSGLCINKRLLPYARVRASLEQGGHDGGIMFRSEDLDSKTQAVAHIRSLAVVVIPKHGVSIDTYGDLTGLQIGKTRSTRLNSRFDTDTTLRKYKLNNYEQAVKMIAAGRLDAVAGSQLVLSYQLNKLDAFEKVDIKGSYVLGYQEQWLQLSDQSPHADKIPLLRSTVVRLKSEGVLDRIMDKHYGRDWQGHNRE